MIYETTRHATESEAIAQGEAFKLSWGFGYGPSYQVYLDNMTGVWICYAMRYSSCDWRERPMRYLNHALDLIGFVALFYGIFYLAMAL